MTERATRVRHRVLALAVAVSVLLYLDRFCLSTTDRDIRTSLGLTEGEMAWILGIFFFPYALGQLPFGLIADRLGARRMLAVAMAAWSIFTGLMGLSVGFWDLLFYRFECGLFESGAYPACAGIIKRWIPAANRGLASGILSLGGRIGGTVTPKITVLLMAASASLWPGGDAWRLVFVVYGLLGIVLAALFWFLYRDRPADHPRVNDAERQLIGLPDAPTRFSIDWERLLTNRSLWICSFVQFGSNFGWVFLLTYLNRYLAEAHQVPLDIRGTMAMIVGVGGTAALLPGGLLTDRLTRRLGRRWGRALPMALPRFVAAALYACVAVRSDELDAWSVVVLLAAVAFFADLTLPAIWAYCLDIGGSSVGAVLGWSNMWGNLGAFVSPLVLNQIVTAFGWPAVFGTCAATFFTIALASLAVDADDRLNHDPEATPSVPRDAIQALRSENVARDPLDPA